MAKPNSLSSMTCFASQFLINFKILHLAQSAVNPDFVTMLIKVGVHFVHFSNHSQFFCYCLAHVLSLVFTHTFHTMWNKQLQIQKCDKTWWHFSMYKTCVFVSSNLIARNSTRHDLTFASRGFVA